MVHQVQSGDNIYRIALRYGVSEQDIRKWNNLQNNNIYAGQILTVKQDVVKPQPQVSEPVRKKQMRFMLNIAKLVIWAFENDYELTAGEFWRTLEQQERYYRDGLSKTMDSMHLERLAADFNIFYQGRHLFASGISEEQYRQDLQDAAPLGKKWRELDVDNVWGADFNRNYDLMDEKFRDPYHFEQKK